MSDRFVRRLGRVRDELEAASGALAYVGVHWQRASIFNFSALETVGLADIHRAADDLEATYFIRLFSTFEGILKEHMAANPAVRVAEDASAASLIDRVARLQTPRISPVLRERVHNVRQYRNFLVHPGGPQPAFVTFPDALARLSRFADKPPDPP